MQQSHEGACPGPLPTCWRRCPLHWLSAGGSAYCDGETRMLDVALDSHDQRSAICLGSTGEVAACLPAMAEGALSTRPA